MAGEIEVTFDTDGDERMVVVDIPAPMILDMRLWPVEGTEQDTISSRLMGTCWFHFARPFLKKAGLYEEWQDNWQSDMKFLDGCFVITYWQE